MKLIYLITILTLTSCISSKGKDDESKVEVLEKDSSPKIIFLNLKLVKNSDESITANFVNKIITDGSLKTKNTKSEVKKAGDFECVFHDDKEMAIDSYYIPNPLVKDIEYVDDAGNLARKIVELDSVELSLRMELPAATRRLSFDLISNPTRELLKIDL